MEQAGLLTTPCELAVRKYVPAIRAAIALVLVKDYGLSVYRAAKILKVTPAAVSNYVFKRRGGEYVDFILGDEELRSRAMELAEKLVGEVVDGYEISRTVCEFCRILRQKIGASELACNVYT